MTDKVIEVAVFMPDHQAKQFLVFQQRYDVFSLMIDRGVFNIRDGSVALHFDHKGDLQTIQRADILYSKRFENA